MLSLSFPKADVVEAARGRILSLLNGDVSMHPEVFEGALWDIELATESECRNVGREIFADVFPESGGLIPAGGETEVLSLIASALDGAEEFGAHVELAHAFLAFCKHDSKASPDDFDWLNELSEACTRLNRMLKADWQPWQGLRIKEERKGAFRILTDNVLRGDRDITGLLPRILLTQDGFCAAPSKGAVARLVTASLLGEQEFRDQVEAIWSKLIAATQSPA
jgi:hypothetical protein